MADTLRTEYSKIEFALKAFLKCLSDLRGLGVITNKKDFTCQLGEWFVSMLYQGERAVSGIQKIGTLKWVISICK